MNTNTSKKTFLLVEGALMIAMAFVLSYIKLYDMPMGGSITLEMIPLVIMGLRHGVKWGTFTAAVHGIIQLIIGFSNVMYCAFCAVFCPDGFYGEVMHRRAGALLTIA